MLKTVMACENQSISISGDCANGTSWQWTNPSNMPIPINAPNITVVAHANQTYRVIATLSNGCVCTTFVTIRTSPMLSSSRTINIYCADSINLDTAGLCSGFTVAICAIRN